MAWWEYLIAPLGLLLGAPLLSRSAHARADRRLGALRQGRAVAVPCRYWTEDGPAPYPRKPVAGRLRITAAHGAHSRMTAFRSRWGRVLPPPHGLVLVGTEDVPRPSLLAGGPWHRLRYVDPGGRHHVFDVSGGEQCCLRDLLDAGTGIGHLTPVTARREAWPPAPLPSLLTALAGIALTLLAGFSGGPAVLFAGLSFLLGGTYSLVRTLVRERRAWPEAYA
ncbi:hypothetical protein ACFY9C_08585 [Streptomyces filamentosus]|uniref:hypothetical protein n=1 Tax=Streptomyces filamentosus TaxID=67294 RepID=UPI0036EB52C0